MNTATATLKDGKKLSISDPGTEPVAHDPETGEVKDLASRQGSEVALTDFGDDAGAGFEDVTKEEYSIPFIRILQTNSPQCEPGVMPGAKPGMFINTATGELFEPGTVTFIPVHREHDFCEYIPRDQGGGFKGRRPVDDPLVIELQAKQGQFGKLQTPDATELVETFYLYGLWLVDGMLSRVVIGFSSTQVKKYRNFITRAMGIQYLNGEGHAIRPPLWAHRWKLGTVGEKNKKGSFFGWTITLDGEKPLDALVPMKSAWYAAGKEFYEMIKAGVARAQAPDREPGADEDEIPM